MNDELCQCLTCLQWKPLSLFAIDTRRKRPYRCRECDRERARKYQASEASKEVRRLKDRKRDLVKVRARVALRNAILKGVVTPWPICAVPECDCPATEGHHPDYSRPLDVVWLCVMHHHAVHKMGRRPMTAEDANRKSRLKRAEARA